MYFIDIPERCNKMSGGKFHLKNFAELRKDKSSDYISIS
jgi:hypothetical protein